MPGGKICSVAICRSNSQKAKQMGESICFFSFPKDPAIRDEWIHKCYRKDQFSAINKRICSKHFKPEDFEDEMKATLLGTQPKKLKKTAIPSLFLLPPAVTANPSENSEDSKRVEQKKTLIESVVKIEIFDEPLQADIKVEHFD